jgi:hypothetical protein
MSTPLTFEDLKVFENVFAVDTSSVSIQTEAARIFNEKFGEDLLPDQVTTRFLFAGDDSEGNQVKVYEASKDSGSKNLIYLTATL